MKCFAKLVIASMSLVFASGALAQTLTLTPQNIAGLHEGVKKIFGKPIKVSARFTTQESGGGHASTLAIFPRSQAIWPLIPCSAVHVISGTTIQMQVDCRDMLANEIRCENLAKAANKKFKALTWDKPTFTFSLEMQSLAQNAGESSQAIIKSADNPSVSISLTKNRTSQFIAERTSSERFIVAKDLGCSIQGVQSVRR